MILLITFLSLLSFNFVKLVVGSSEFADQSYSESAAVSAGLPLSSLSEFRDALEAIQAELNGPEPPIGMSFAVKRILQILHSNPEDYAPLIEPLAAAFHYSSKSSRETGSKFWEFLTGNLTFSYSDDLEPFLLSLLNEVAQSPDQPLAIYGPLMPFAIDEDGVLINDFVSCLFGNRYTEILGTELSRIESIGIKPTEAPRNEAWVDFLVAIYHLPRCDIHFGPDTDLQLAYIVESFIQYPLDTFSWLRFHLDSSFKLGSGTVFNDFTSTDSLQQYLLRMALGRSPEQAHQPLRNLTNFPAGFDLSSAISVKAELNPIEPRSFALFRKHSRHACKEIEGLTQFEREFICKTLADPRTRYELRFFMTAFASTQLCFPNFIDASPHFWHSLIYHVVVVMTEAFPSAFHSVFPEMTSFTAYQDVSNEMYRFYSSAESFGYFHFLRHSILYGHDETVLALLFNETFRLATISIEQLFEHFILVIKSGNARLASIISPKLINQFTHKQRELIYIATASTGLFSLLPIISYQPENQNQFSRDAKIKAIKSAALAAHLKTLKMLLNDLSAESAQPSPQKKSENPFSGFSTLSDNEFQDIFLALLEDSKLPRKKKSSESKSSPTAAPITVEKEKEEEERNPVKAAKEDAKAAKEEAKSYVIKLILSNYIQNSDRMKRALEAIRFCGYLGRIDLIQFIVDPDSGCKIPLQDQRVQDTIFASIWLRSRFLQTTKPFVKLARLIPNCRASQDALNKALLRSVEKDDYKILKFLIDGSGMTFPKSIRQNLIWASIDSKKDLIPLYLLKHPKFRPRSRDIPKILIKLLQISSYHNFKEFCLHWEIQESPELVKFLFFNSVQFSRFKPFEFFIKTYLHLLDSTDHNLALRKAMKLRRFFIIEFYLENSFLHRFLVPALLQSAEQLMFSKWNLNDKILDDLVASMMCGNEKEDDDSWNHEFDGESSSDLSDSTNGSSSSSSSSSDNDNGDDNGIQDGSSSSDSNEDDDGHLDIDSDGSSSSDTNEEDDGHLDIDSDEDNHNGSDED